ncbi:uncharacterized protein LOC144882912 [Branchiostoma floridae x Branchiostoma japonicum]
MEKKKKEKSQARKKKNKIAPSEMKVEAHGQVFNSQGNSGESSGQVQMVKSSAESGAVHSTIRGSCSKEPDKGIQQSSSSGGSAGCTDGLTLQSSAPGTKSSAPSGFPDVQLPGGSGENSHVSLVKKKKRRKRRRSRSAKRTLKSAVGSRLLSGSKKSKGSSQSKRRSMQVEFAKLTARAMLMALSYSPLTAAGGRGRGLPVHSQTPTERTGKSHLVDSGFSTKERATLPQTVIDRSGFKYPVTEKKTDKGHVKKVVLSKHKEPAQSERLCHLGTFSTKDREVNLENQENKQVKKGGVHMERKSSGQDGTQGSCSHTAVPSDVSSSSSESSSGDESCSDEEPTISKSLAQTQLSDAVGKPKKALKTSPSVSASHTDGDIQSAKGKHPANGKQGKVKRSKKPDGDKCKKKKEYKIKTRYVTPISVETDSEATKKRRKKLHADGSKLDCGTGKLKQTFEKEGVGRSPQTFSSSYTSRLVNLLTLSRLVQGDKTAVASTVHKKKRKKKTESKAAKVEKTFSYPGANNHHEIHSKVEKAPMDKQTGLSKVYQEEKKDKETGKDIATMDTNTARDVEPSCSLETLTHHNPGSMGSGVANKATVQDAVADHVMSSRREGKGTAPLQNGASVSRNKEKSGVSKKKISKKRKKQGTSISNKKVGDIGKTTFTSTSTTLSESPNSVTQTATKNKTVLHTTEMAKHASSTQVKLDVELRDINLRQTMEVTSDMQKSNTPDTQKTVVSTVGTKKPSHTGISHSTGSTSPFSLNGNGTPDSTGTVKSIPSTVVSSKIISDIIGKEGAVATKGSVLDEDNSASGTGISNSIVSTTDDIQLIESTSTDRHSQRSKDKHKSALVTAAMHSTISGTDDRITADTTGEDGIKFDEAGSDKDISATTDKDDSCIIITDTPEKQQESSTQEPSMVCTTVSTSTMSDGVSAPETATKTNTNLHCQSSQVTKDVSVQLTRLEDEIMYLRNRTKSTNTKEEKNIGKSKATKKTQDGERLVEDNKAGSGCRTSQDNEILVEEYTEEDDKMEGNTVSQLSQQDSSSQSVLTVTAAADKSRSSGTDKHTVTSTPKREKSPDSSKETLLVVSTSIDKISTIEDSCPHLPHSACPQCLSGSEQEQEEFDKSNLSRPEAGNIFTTQDMNVASEKDADINSDNLELPTSVKIGDISYTLDEVDLMEEQSNTVKSEEEENSPRGFHSTPCKTTTGEVQGSTRQVLQIEDDIPTKKTKDSELNHNIPHQKKERRAHLEKTIQRVWEKCGFKSPTSAVTDIGTMETPEEEPSGNLHNNMEVDDDATPDPNSLATVTNSDASSKPPVVSGLVQNGVGRHNSEVTGDSCETVETESIEPCASACTTAATSTFVETHELQPNGNVALERRTIETEEEKSCINSLEESLLLMQSQESAEMFANMFVNAMYGEGEPGNKSTFSWDVYTSSSDSEGSTGLDTSSEESVGSEESGEDSDCNVPDNPEEESNKENDPVSKTNVQTASDFENSRNDTVITKDSGFCLDVSDTSKDGYTENEDSNQPRDQSSNAVGSFSHNNGSQPTETVFITEDDMDLGALSELEEAVSDDDSSTYSFIPGDHSQGPEVPEDDVEDLLESVNISPIIGSANAVGGTDCQKKTCRRSLFEYHGDNDESAICKEDMQEDINQNLRLVLNTSRSSEEDWTTPLKPLVADYSSPGLEGMVEMPEPFSQDVEGDQLLSDYMSGIEPILTGHFEATKGSVFGEEKPPKQNGQEADNLSREVEIQTSQLIDSGTTQIQTASPLVEQTKEQEHHQQVMIRKTPSGNILRSSRCLSSTTSDDGSGKAAGKGGTPSGGKDENLERETERDAVSSITKGEDVGQGVLSAEPGHVEAATQPPASAPAGVQHTSVTGLQQGQRKRRAHADHSYSSPQQLLLSKKRQAKEEAIQKLTTKGRKDKKSSASCPSAVEVGENNDHSYSKTFKQKKKGGEDERQSGYQKNQQTAQDGQRGLPAQNLLMSKIQQLSGSRLVLPASSASSHVKSVEGRKKRKFLVAMEEKGNALPSGVNMNSSKDRIIENGNADAAHTRNVQRGKQKPKKDARMTLTPFSRKTSEAKIIAETETLSETQDTMDNVIPPSQTDDTMKKKYVVSPRGAQGKEKTATSMSGTRHVEPQSQDKQTTQNDDTIQGQTEEAKEVQKQGIDRDERHKGAAGKRPTQEILERDETGNKKKARTSTPEKNKLEPFHMEHTRGMFGWEDSLRQRLSPVKRFQPEAPPNADDKGKKRKKEEQGSAVKKKMKMQPLAFTTIRSSPATSSKGNLAVPKDTPAVSAAASTSSAPVTAPVTPGATSTSSIPENCSPTDKSQEEQLPQEYKDGKYGMGELVFGKLKGYTWWPGRVVSCVETGRDPAPEGSCWVRWFGDGKFSIVQVEDKLEPFGKFSQLYHERTYNRLQTYKRAILESLQVAADRAKKKFLSSPEAHKNQDRDRAMVQWALQDFSPAGPDSLKPSSEEARPPDHLVHQWLQVRHLKQLEQVAEGRSSGSGSRRESVDSRLERAKLFEEVRKRQLSVDQVCLACGSLDVETQHPLFRGGLCEGCRIEFLESSYQFDEDGYQSYCSLCAAGTEVLMCGQDSCCRSFCKDCLDLIVGPGTADQAVLEDPWLCYMCREEPRHGLLHRQQDWSARLQQFFAMDDVEDFGQPKLYPPVPAQQRRPIRVLSLYDGIGTALLVLKELGVTVDVCYASEIDPDAIKVSQLRHAGGIRHLGDIRSIRNTDIPKLGPFDLVLGGSPCNDLSIANPNRAGLYGGTGVMFFNFYRLLREAAPAPGDDRPFFWLFENVVAMKHQYKQDISLFLGCNPVVVDAKDVSPAHRARYFWGNLPGMNRPLVPQASDKLALEQCLEKGCGRVAQVKKVRTVTTTLHSVRNQGKQQAAPVLMEGQPDTLWCTELERVFGFPSHYTDVCNMSRCSRQRLLGRAWSIPVIRHLLAPLKDYFQCQDKE